MEKYLDLDIYKKAKAKADATYKNHSAYKSMFLTKTYKEMGGRYKTSKTSKDNKLATWRKEEWVQVLPFLLENKKVRCGDGMNPKGCRPTKRVNKETPMTLQELIKKHGKEKLLKLAKMKRKNMAVRVNWEQGKLF